MPAQIAKNWPLPHVRITSALAQLPSPLSVRTQHNFEKFEVFCTKRCGRSHRKNPPCPHWTNPPPPLSADGLLLLRWGWGLLLLRWGILNENRSCNIQTPCDFPQNWVFAEVQLTAFEDNIIMPVVLPWFGFTISRSVWHPYHHSPRWSNVFGNARF